MIGHGDCAVARDMGAPDQFGGQEYTVREDNLGVEIVDSSGRPPVRPMAAPKRTNPLSSVSPGRPCACIDAPYFPSLAGKGSEGVRPISLDRMLLPSPARPSFLVHGTPLRQDREAIARVTYPHASGEHSVEPIVSVPRPLRWL
jgi:hypothetical protein